MKAKRLLSALCLCLALSIGYAGAQSVKGVVNAANTATKVIGNITGHLKSVELEGTWVYSGAAVAFQSDNFLQKAGGAVAATAIENKLDAQFAKLGIEKGKSKFEFTGKGKFTHTVKGNKLRGTYNYDADSGIITLKYARLIPVKAHLQGNSKKIEMLFDSSEFLTLISFIGGHSGSAIIKSITSIVNMYDGMMVGFELKKQ